VITGYLVPTVDVSFTDTTNLWLEI